MQQKRLFPKRDSNSQTALQPLLLTDRWSVGVSWVRGIACNVFKRVAVLVVIRIERGLHVNVLVSAVDKMCIC